MERGKISADADLRDCIQQVEDGCQSGLELGFEFLQFAPDTVDLRIQHFVNLDLDLVRSGLAARFESPGHRARDAIDRAVHGVLEQVVQRGCDETLHRVERGFDQAPQRTGRRLIRDAVDHRIQQSIDHDRGQVGRRGCQ